MARVLAPQLPSAHLFAARPPRTHRFLLLECELPILLDVGILGLVLELPTALAILYLLLFILRVLVREEVAMVIIFRTPATWPTASATT